MSEVDRQQPLRVLVVGSLNLDLVTRVPQLPRAGETVRGSSLAYLPGGKGANQAVAAARLGARCSMIGRVGDDGFGQTLLESLHAESVETNGVEIIKDCASGVALISVEENGENAITILAGANGELTSADLRKHQEQFAAADILLLQLETPLPTVLEAIRLAHEQNLICILDPAPAPVGEFPAELLAVDLITPNQTEAELLTGIAVTNLETAAQAATKFHAQGATRAVITLGAEGAYYSEQNGQSFHVPAFNIEPVDTTAAGDAFAGALAVAWGAMEVESAIRFACAAGALAATRPGAQPAMPVLDEVQGFLAEQ